jgi:hypothetical protein
MTEQDYVILIAGIILVVIYRNRDMQTGAVRLPPWAWKLMGAFLLFTFLRHLQEVIHFTISESDKWWPLIKATAHDFSEQLRHLFQVMRGEA